MWITPVKAPGPAWREQHRRLSRGCVPSSPPPGLHSTVPARIHPAAVKGPALFSDNGATLLVKWTPARTGDNEARVKLGCLGREPGSREKRGEKEWDNMNRKEKEAERCILWNSPTKGEGWTWVEKQGEMQPIRFDLLKPETLPRAWETTTSTRHHFRRGQKRGRMDLFPLAVAVNKKLIKVYR